MIRACTLTCLVVALSTSCWANDDVVEQQTVRTLLGHTNLLEKSARVFVGTFDSVEWNQKQPSLGGRATFTCSDSIVGSKKGETIVLSLAETATRPVDSTGSWMWRQFVSEKGTHYLLFVSGRDDKAEVLGIVALKSVDAPIVQEVKEALIIHAMPASERQAAISKILSASDLRMTFAVKYCLDMLISLNDRTKAASLAAVMFAESSNDARVRSEALFNFICLRCAWSDEASDRKLWAQEAGMLLDAATSFTGADAQLQDRYLDSLRQTFFPTYDVKPPFPPQRLTLRSAASTITALTKLQRCYKTRIKEEEKEIERMKDPQMDIPAEFRPRAIKSCETIRDQLRSMLSDLGKLTDALATQATTSPRGTAT